MEWATGWIYITSFSEEGQVFQFVTENYKINIKILQFLVISYMKPSFQTFGLQIDTVSYFLPVKIAGDIN